MLRRGTPHTVLFDGSCRFCVDSTARLRRLVNSANVRFLDFNSPGVLDSFPEVTPDQCRAGMQVVTADRKVYSGAEAAARLLMMHLLLAPLAVLYFIPGLRFLWDRAYALLARNRYRLRGRVPAHQCESGTCPVHGSASLK